MMTDYGVSTGEGGQITIGLSYRDAMRVAQQLANERCETLFVWPVGEAGGDEEIAVTPQRVMDYETGDALEGEPSEELVEASAAEHSGTGAVAAYRDEHGIWRHVADADVSAYEARGETVRTVYVEA